MEKTVLLKKEERGLIRKTGQNVSILGIEQRVCQISAKNVKKWPRYRCDVRTDGRTNGRTDTSEF